MRERPAWIAPVLVLVFGWALCGTFYASAVQRQRAGDQERFTRFTGSGETTIQLRVTAYIEALQAGAAFLRASHDVTRAEWREFAATIDVAARYPGIRGLGVILPVQGSDRDAFVRTMRADGAPTFAPHAVPGAEPMGDESALIAFVEPEPENRAALGLDVLTEPRRRRAALEARDTGLPQMTSRIALVQAHDGRPSSLLFVPVYRAGTRPTSVAARRENHIGWVYAPLVLEELVRGAMGGRSGRLRLTVYEGDKVDADQVLYRSDLQSTSTDFERVSRLVLAGHQYTLGWSRGSEFELPAPASQIWATGFGGVVALLLAGLVLSFQTTSRRARALARELNRDMIAAQAELERSSRLQRAVLDGTTHAVISTSPDGRVTMFNRGAEEMLGYRSAEVVGKTTPATFHVPHELETRAEELSSLLGTPVPAGFEALVARVRGGEPDEREWTYVAKDGTHKPVLAGVTALHDDRGAITGFLVIAQDLTERKKSEIAVKATEERLASVLGHAECLVWEAKVAMTPTDWTWRMAVFPSALYRRFLGHRPPHTDAGLWYQFEVPDQAAMNRRARQAMEEGQSGYVQEFRIVHDNGTSWVRESVAITQEEPGHFWLIGVAIDITERKRAEAALQENEQRMSDVFRSMAEGLMLLKPDGTITQCNEAAVRILGLERKVEGASSFSAPGWTIITEEGVPLTPEKFPNRITAETGATCRNLVLGLHPPSRPVLWLSVNTEPVRGSDNRVRAVVVSFTDVTARKLAEENVVRSQRLLETIANRLPGLIAYWTPDLRCAFSNGEYLAWFGHTADSMRDMRMQDLLGPDLFIQNEPYVRGVLAGRPQQFERQLTKTNGEVRHTWAQYIPDFESDGTTVRGFVVLVSDVTDMKRQQEALRASEGRLRASLQEVTNLQTALDAHAIVSVTDAEGRITYANELFCQLSRYSREEVIGQTHRIVSSGAHPPEFFEQMWRTITAGRIWHGEICNRAKDGTLNWVDATIVPFLGDDGKPVQYIAVRTDITPRKRLEQSLAVARDQALEASRLKSEFLATMSHEIRTPMNAIIGMTSVLLDTAVAPEQTDMLRVVSSAAENLLTIINDILDFSRIEAGKLRLDLADFDLCRVTDEALALLAPRAHAKHITLNLDFDPPPDCQLHGDAGRVRQVLLNLVGNAVKFTDKGEVLVTVKAQPEAQDWVRVRFVIRDTGIGIPAESRDRLFRPFVQVDGSATRRFGGTGLGLAITRQLVLAMDGDIGFESEAGHGSTFWFELCLPRRAPIPSLAPTVLPGRRVLVVEPRASTRDLLIRQLERNGLVVEAESSSRVVLERLRAQGPGELDAVILEADMPEMSGLDVAIEFRATPALARLPVVLLSHATMSDLPAASAIGMSVALTRPIYAEKLAQAIARLVTCPVTRPTALPRGEGELARKGLRLLVAEDNVPNQRVAVLLLTKLGHSVELANNGEEALQRLAAERFDGVLMDCQMPVLDGFETTRRIRAGVVPGVNPALPIVALTAYARPEDQERCKAVGMDGYVAKPIRIAELVAGLAGIKRAETAPDISEAAETSSILDLEVVETTRRLPGSKGDSLLPELVALFRQDETATMTQLADLLGRRAGAELAELVHSFGGNAASFGAVEVRRIALELEACVRAGKWVQADQRFIALDAARRRLQAALLKIGLT